MIWKLYHFLPCNYVLNEILHVLAWLIKNCREPGELICRFIKSHPLWWSLYLKIQPVNAGDTWILCNRRRTRYKLLFFPIPQVYYLSLSCWSVYLSIYYLSVLSIFQSILLICLFVNLSCSLSICLSILLFCLLSIYLVVLSIWLSLSCCSVYLSKYLISDPCFVMSIYPSLFLSEQKMYLFYPICLLCLIYLFFF